MRKEAAAEARKAALHMEAQAEACEAPLHMEAQAEACEAPLHMEAQAEACEAPLHMEAQAATEESEAPLRTHSFLFGCVLDGISRKVSFPGGCDDLGEQLTLRTVSLGLGARDVLHVLEVLGETQEGTIRVPVATLRPSLLTSVYLGGLELTPPVTFWLTAGTGPLYISGQHLVAITERDAAAAKAIAAKREAAAKVSAKREAAHREAAAKASAERKAAAAKASAERWEAAATKASAEREAAATKAMVQRLAAAAKASAEREAAQLPPVGRLKMEGQRLREEPGTAQGAVVPTSSAGHGPRTLLVCPGTRKVCESVVQKLSTEELPPSHSNGGARPSDTNPLTVERMKKKLVSFSKHCSVPRRMEKFLIFAHFTLGTDDPQLVQQLWEFVLSEKLNKPPPTGEKNHPLTVEQMKEKLVSLSLKGGVPNTMEKFQMFAHFNLRTKDPLIVQQLWEFVLSEKLPVTVEQMKEKLVAISLKGGCIPKTMEKFRKFAHLVLCEEEPRIVQQLWEFVRSEKFNQSIERNYPLTLDQMKDKLVPLSLKQGGLPTTMRGFRKFVRTFFLTEETRIVQQLWQFARKIF